MRRVVDPTDTHTLSAGAESPLAGGPDDVASPSLEPGTTLGRFIVEGLLGSGGMGEVYRARDPTLDRVVALKVLRGDRDERGEARLVGEAQALARLAHPNVVSVHEVGLAGSQVYLAMEHVDGETLADHLRGRTRPWRDVVALYSQAGRGLAAAHARGIVHRDFKPANVLVDREGRVRVGDFGLAARLGAEGPDVDRLVGTPHYIAPEQRARQAATAKSDQYSFCVSLWEELFGAPWPARKPGVPARVASALEKGLSADPAARHESMGELLGILERAHDPARARRRWLPVAALGLVAAGVVGRRALEAPPCGGAEARVAPLWDDAARAQVAAAFRATGRVFALDTFPRVDAALRAWQRDWAAAHRDACEATEVRHEQSPALLDARMACLARARGEMDALVAQLAVADAATLEHATEAALSTAAVADCRHPSPLAAPPPDPEAARVAAELPRLVVLRRLGRWREGLEAARDVARRATRLAYPPLLAAIALQTARFEMDAGDDDAAIEGLYDAARLGSEAGDDDVVAAATTELVFALLIRKQRDDAAAVAQRLAAAAVARAGNTPARLSRLFRWQARLLQRRGDQVSPLLLMQLVVALELASHGPDSYEAADAMSYLAGMMIRLGLFQQGKPAWDRAIAATEKVLGPDHPYVAEMLANFGFGLANAMDPPPAPRSSARWRSTSARLAATMCARPSRSSTSPRCGAPRVESPRRARSSNARSP